MSLIKHDPYSSLLGNIRNEIDQMFSNNLTATEFPALSWNGNGYWPEVDIEDNEKNYIVTANVPGMNPKDIDVNYTNGNLTIKGKTSSKHEEKGKNYIRTERSEGSFCRSFSLPDVDDKKINAEYKNGLLTIDLPKTQSSAVKKIEIKT